MAVPQNAWGYIAGTVEVTDRDFEIFRSLYRPEIAYLDRRSTNSAARSRTTTTTPTRWRSGERAATSESGELGAPV